ncbi:T9SS type A sorting domain-containing protein [Algoriphagus sp. AGSA1]|uniref:LamG-like jellyroll fold domain-containing protein n=1 Tax=Algoriphagus sp. AGSA1 TaxID=2907213 RepID=UPI001F15B121|nr:LamG-like jellyroll fold domain-containing protein [Algoriphagus sp. AGSA1]MCE7053265.1 T9SS type A sorting domain-containing protein [Algoriphagus sp. AGSA1]
MKKIVTVQLLLNIFSVLIIENYSFSFSLLNSNYNLVGEGYTSVNCLSEVDVLHDVKAGEDILLEKKPIYLLEIGPMNYSDSYLIVNPIYDSSLGEIGSESIETDYSSGEKITVTAEVNPGFKFVNWTIDGKEVSKMLVYEFVMPSRNINIQANFIKEVEVPSKPEVEVPSKPEAETGLLNGLVSFYEMNTNLSSVLKDSHGQNHGVNAQISHVQGFNEKGNRYDPKSSISSVPHSNSLNLATEFTLMADIFREGNGKPDGSVIIGKTYSSAWPENQTYSLAITADNRLRIRTNSSGLRDWFSTQTVPLRKWVRVIATYKSGEGYRLYLDTVVPEKSPQFSGAISKSDLKLTIGSASLLRNAAYARRLEGVLDNVGIWNRKLSQEEIAELITTKITYPDFGGVQEVSKVRVISPIQNAEFDAMSDIQIEIEPESKNGEFNKVELYNGNTLIATLAERVSTFTWKAVPTGQYNIKAKAFHGNGTFTESVPVSISVVERENIVSKPGTGKGLLEGLVAFYEMNTNLSSVLRDSHGQNHGVNEQISHVPGFNEKGNRYDPKSSISSVPHSNSLNLATEFTLMADVFREGNGQRNSSILVGKTFSSAWPENQTYSLAITADNRLRIRTNSSGLRDWVSTQTVPFGKWVRVIATYKSGEGYRLYLDAVVPEKSPQFSGAITRSDLKLTIGSASLLRNAAYTRRFEGVLDNVGIWNRKLSQEEITELITTKITYPDFKGNESYRITLVKATEDISGERTFVADSIHAEVGEKLILLVEEEEGAVFDHWSVDEVQMSSSVFYELDVPDKDLVVTQHFRKFAAPEINLVLPDDRYEFDASSEVHIGFEIKSNDSEIEKIELLNGSEVVGQIAQDSSGFDWKNIPAGNHQLVGRITDTGGNTYFSNPVVLKAVGYQSRDLPNVLLEYVIGPNPSREYLNVIFTNLDRSYDFEFHVVSMNGTVQKTFEARPEGDKVTIDVSDLVNGVYILQLTANGHDISSKKFIKK